MWQDDEISRLLGTLGPVTKYQRPGVDVPFDGAEPSLRDRTVPTAPYAPDNRVAPNSVFDSVVDVPRLPQPSGFALANKFNQSQQNPIGSMASSADMDAARRQQAQSAWNQGAGSDQWQPPLNSMLPGNYVPPPSSGTPQPASMYSDFVGPQYDRNAQQAMAGPRMDSSVNGLLPAAEGWNGSQASPYAALDNFMSRDPVHTLGVNGFRTGSSNASVDYSGPMQRQQAIRNNMDIEAMLGRQDIARGANQLDAMRFMLASQDRQDAVRQRRQHDFDVQFSHLLPGQRTPFIEEASRNGILSPEAGSNLLHDDLFDVAKKAAGGLDPTTGRPKDIDKMVGVLAQAYSTGKYNKFDVIRRLQSLGITGNYLDKYVSDPAMKPFVDALTVPRKAEGFWENLNRLIP